MPDDTEENKRDRVIAAIYEVLPATTCDEIATKVSRKLRETVTRGEIYNDIYHLRRNSKEYTWSIPHVRRGIAREQDEHRYFAVPVDRDGIYVLDETPEARDHLQNGSVGTMAQHHHGDELGWWAAHGVTDPFALAITYYQRYQRSQGT